MVGEARRHRPRPAVGELQHERVRPGVTRASGFRHPLAEHADPAPTGVPHHRPGGQEDAVAVSLDEEHRDDPHAVGTGDAEQGVELAHPPGVDPAGIGHEAVPGQPDTDLPKPRSRDRGQVGAHRRGVERLPEKGPGGGRLVVEADGQSCGQ